jgi:nuclear pore complex protein Nup54
MFNAQQQASFTNIYNHLVSLEDKFDEIRNAYDPNHPKCRFRQVFYDRLSPTPGSLPRDPKMTVEEYAEACGKNPDPQTLAPKMVVGANELEAKAKNLKKEEGDMGVTLEKLAQMVDSCKAKAKASDAKYRDLQRKQKGLELRLMRTLVKVALSNNLYKPLTKQEVEFRDGVEKLSQKIEKHQTSLTSITSSLPSYLARRSADVSTALPASVSAKVERWLEDQCKAIEQLARIKDDDERRLAAVMAAIESRKR